MSIRKFRKRMKPFILIITIVFLISLMFGGYQSFQTSRANKKAQEALRLNGTNISKMIIEREKNKVADLYQKNANIQLDKEFVEIIALNQVIEKELVLELSKKIKIKVPSSEVNKEYESVEETIGDKAQFKRMLEFQGLTKASYKEKIKEELLVRKTLESFTSEIKPTEDEIKSFYKFNIQDKTQDLESSRDKIVKAIQQREGSKNYIAAIAKLKKEAKIKEISKEYENLIEKIAYEEAGFKITNLDLAKESARQALRMGKTNKNNKEEIEKRAKVSITKGIELANKAKEKGIVVSQDIPFENQILQYSEGLIQKYREEVKVSDKELKEFFEANKERYEIKAYVNANLAFINIKGSDEDDKEAKEKAESILKEVDKDNFDKKGEELAKKNEYIYEDLGTFSKGMMVKEFEEAVKETASGTITKNVVKTGFGYHVVFVKENNSKESKWTVSHILVRVKPSQKTIDEKIEKLKKIKVDLEKGALKFSEIQKLDEDIVQDVKIDGITPDGNIPNIGYNKEITDKIFAATINEVGIIRNDSMVVLFEKTKEVKNEVANFEKSKLEVKTDFINYKALEKMRKIF